MIITDRYDHVIDEKNRLAIPSPIRNALHPDTDGSVFYLVPEVRYLQLIPERLFERLANVKPVGLMPAHDVAKARRYLFANASRLEPDKQGRVMIPDRFLLDGKTRDPIFPAFLSRDVTLVGAVDRLELWNRTDFIAHMRELNFDRPSFEAVLQQMYGAAPATTVSFAPPGPGGPGGTQ
jgi:MraZ protein